MSNDMRSMQDMFNGCPSVEATKPKSAAECAAGLCDCDPHIETCDKCAPYLHETKPQEPTSIPSGEDYAETHKIAVTKEWLAGWNNCKELVEAFPVATKQQTERIVELEAEVEKWSADFVRISDNYSEEAQMNMDFGAERLAFILKEQKQAERIAELEAELERERIRLAACGVVALANTPDSAAKQREMLPEYESGSLESVKHIVDSEMALRAERDALAMQNQQMLEALEAVDAVAEISDGIAGWHLNGNIAGWSEILPEVNDVLFLPDNTEAIIKRHDAAVLRKAAEVCESRQTPGTGSVAILSGAANELRRMAAELEKS